MARLNDFITDLERTVTAANQVPSHEQLEQAMTTAAIKIERDHRIYYLFADGELLSLNDFIRYANNLVA